MSGLEIITDPFERSGVAAGNSPRRIKRCFCLLVVFTRKLKEGSCSVLNVVVMLIKSKCNFGFIQADCLTVVTSYMCVSSMCVVCTGKMQSRLC
jgi:hypothetical protein